MISSGYLQQGQQAIQRRKKQFRSLLSERRLPTSGWDDQSIEMFLQEVAAMDSNNFLDSVGVGEREARVASGLVARRHYGLAHGIGRSGDIAAEQPKAAGSSLLQKLTNVLTKDTLRLAGFGDLGEVSVIPVATGMAISLTVLALKAGRPSGAEYMLWPRVDQKTCLKSLVLAGVKVVPMPMKRIGDQLCTDIDSLGAKVSELGADKVLGIVTTTSCFAPRAADDVVAVAKLCAEHGIGHIINNAYGVQAQQLTRQITMAWRRGRVDAVIQSTDKNFMVPVGGAVICAGAKNDELVAKVNQSYPGRASMAPSLDLLITLLHWGATGWTKVLQEREELLPAMRIALSQFAKDHAYTSINDAFPAAALVTSPALQTSAEKALLNMSILPRDSIIWDHS
ncbi:hypothetical protein WJX84_004792 [Apatococcus fuscideae]|uniref:O-phosphoseryl-tRNA(Sec) selenium transferase n=1 Tax=Apatococcus fuscideae TaxID=2026836 RepID=A0AAW1SNR7_9CHLO